MPLAYEGGEPATVAERLLMIRSDLLEIQHRLEMSKLAVAEDRLGVALALIEHEQALRKDERDRVEAEKDYRNEQLTAEKLRHQPRQKDCELPNKACLGQPATGRLYAAGTNASRLTADVFKNRQDYQFDSELPDRVQIARREVESARQAVNLIRASLDLGAVSCPRSCRLDSVFVTNGQYVTKGDPLVEVCFVNSLPNDAP